MPARTPNQVHELWTKAFIAHDLSALVALYEPDAVLAPAPDERCVGQEAIRAALAGFLALQPTTFQMNVAQVVQTGDLAVLFSPWQLVGTGPEGDEVRMGGMTADVVRRQPDGQWLMVIDSPFGGSPLFAGTAAP